MAVVQGCRHQPNPFEDWYWAENKLSPGLFKVMGDRNRRARVFMEVAASDVLIKT